MQKRKSATNRVAIGPIWAILCAQKAMLLGYSLGRFRTPGRAKNGPKKPQNLPQQILETNLSFGASLPPENNALLFLFSEGAARTDRALAPRARRTPTG